MKRLLLIAVIAIIVPDITAARWRVPKPKKPARDAVLVVGSVSDSLGGLIRSVLIYGVIGDTSVYADTYGIFNVWARAGDTLVFRHYLFDDVKLKVNNDHDRMDVVLHAKNGDKLDWNGGRWRMAGVAERQRLSDSARRENALRPKFRSAGEAAFRRRGGKISIMDEFSTPVVTSNVFADFDPTKIDSAFLESIKEKLPAWVHRRTPRRTAIEIRAREIAWDLHGIRVDSFYIHGFLQNDAASRRDWRRVMRQTRRRARHEQPSYLKTETGEWRVE